MVGRIAAAAGANGAATGRRSGASSNDAVDEVEIGGGVRRKPYASVEVDEEEAVSDLELILRVIV